MGSSSKAYMGWGAPYSIEAAIPDTDDAPGWYINDRQQVNVDGPYPTRDEAVAALVNHVAIMKSGR